ncbi:MAG: PDZ domain-containing protein [Planctomycetota bacterium]|nr:MAG: PDZ domain-containing protein [Planctomycetota bacterium]
MQDFVFSSAGKKTRVNESTSHCVLGRPSVQALFAVALGALAGLWLVGGGSLDRVAGPGTAPDRAGIIVHEPAAGQFVQEPAQRSSFRPDLSSGLRISNQRNNLFVLRSFHDAIGQSWQATVRVSAGGDQVALGVVVDARGWILTKASQLPGDEDIYCELYNGREYPAQIVDKAVDNDLALLHIDADGLPVAQWRRRIPPRGSWVATTDASEMPRAVGVVSTGIVAVEQSTAVLGVNLTDTSQGAAVIHVLPGTGADLAGLRMGDTIFEVNGRSVTGLRSFRRAITGMHGGDTVALRVRRGDQELALKAILMDLSDELLDDTEMEVSGPVSARSTGFEQVFMHDTVLQPHECGGPLVDLDGQVVGLNIARAGRVTTYALPADVVLPLVDEMLQRARLVQQDSAAQSNSVR